MLLQPKWIAKSTTAWGGVIALASAAAPIISAITGIDVTQDDINTGVSKTAEVVQAVGGLIGFGIMIYGRFKKQIQPVSMSPNAAPQTVEIKGKVSGK